MLRKIFHNGREVRSGWRLLLFCVLFFALGYVFRKGLERLHLPDYPPLHPMDLIIGEGGTLMVALIATAIMSRLERRSLAVYGIPRLRDLFGRLFWAGVVWGLVMPSAIILLIFLGGGYRVHGLNVTGGELFKFAGLWLITNLAIGFGEEITFRGYFLYTLADGIGFWAAAMINAVGFGALHYYTKPNERWEDWVAVTLLTVFITLALRRTGGLAFPIGMHAAFDFMFLYVFSGMNGGHFAIGRLLNAEFPGSTGVTGGLLGPEASWFCFPVAIAAIALLHFTYRKANWPARAKD
ncbi:MAG TPA: CPBP family intramembrane glutamic endopeptidase [Candidatus Sulfotelmatobacter sp.]|nr:CPBP family intramembrane glutamic endopeptidase [Candidatus Sulfotelmatobacter sp.]